MTKNNKNLQEEKNSTELAEVHQAFRDDNDAKLDELYNKPGQLESVKQEIGNAGKVRVRSAIVAAIGKLASSLGRIPSAFEISVETGYSTNTVYKHIRELNSQNIQEEEMRFFTTQKSRWLGLIMQAATPDESGKVDLKAVKMGLDIIMANQKTPSVTNAIQIVLSFVPKKEQEKVKMFIQQHVSQTKATRELAIDNDYTKNINHD